MQTPHGIAEEAKYHVQSSLVSVALFETQLHLSFIQKNSKGAMKIALLLFVWLLPRLAAGFDYSLADGAALVLTDVETSIADIKTLFRREETLVSVKDIKWIANENGDTTGQSVLLWQTFVDRQLIASGSVSLADAGRELPTTIENVGNFTIDRRGRVPVEVLMRVDNSTESASGEYQAYNKGWSLAPLLAVLVLAMTTRMVCE